jgi:hypothetical protein
VIVIVVVIATAIKALLSSENLLMVVALASAF